MKTAIDRQREHYLKTSDRMADLSVIEMEHNHAIALLSGLARQYGWIQFLDVGAGSGRGIVHLKRYLPQANIRGVEPVDALRKLGYEGGLSESELIKGDALKLAFPDQSIQVVYATGIMHHLATPRLALKEMLRVASQAVYISDLNNYGCGAWPQRALARFLRFLGLWKPFQWVKNGGRLDKYSDGDGVYFSYSLFDEMDWLNKQGLCTYIFTTKPTRGNPFWDTSHIALLVLKHSTPLLP
jgi:SAM-dependent methyltransferase